MGLVDRGALRAAGGDAGALATGGEVPDTMATAPALTAPATGPAETAGSQPAKHVEREEEAAPPVLPTSLGAVRVLLIGIVWLFVAAVVLGPVAMHFERARPPEMDAGHAGHDAHSGH